MKATGAAAALCGSISIDVQSRDGSGIEMLAVRRNAVARYVGAAATVSSAAQWARNPQSMHEKDHVIE